MQLISIQIIYIMHNTLASINYKRTQQISRFGMHQGLPCSKKMLGSAALDECYPPSFLLKRKSSNDDG
jgi:hypothetical protein